MSHILAVDDEPNNLAIIESYVEDAGYTVDTASDGVEAWEILQEKYAEIEVILLDRMMPRMDGMDLLAKVKGDQRMKNIPVIMQTAAAEKNQVVEGIKAGAYYYLTKPFEGDVLIAIVNSAFNEYSNYKKLQTGANSIKSMAKYVTESHFVLSSLDDAYDVSTFLSAFFPKPEEVVTGISELLVNAVEHGNLGITYKDKGDFNISDSWLDEVHKRQNMSENKHKKVKIDYKRDDKKITLHIADEGEGFDWQKYMEIDPDRATDSHGRGIALANMISFDKVEYLGKGNEVVCTTYT